MHAHPRSRDPPPWRATADETTDLGASPATPDSPCEAASEDPSPTTPKRPCGSLPPSLRTTSPHKKATYAQIQLRIFQRVFLLLFGRNGKIVCFQTLQLISFQLASFLQFYAFCVDILSLSQEDTRLRLPFHRNNYSFSLPKHECPLPPSHSPQRKN